MRKIIIFLCLLVLLGCYTVNPDDLEMPSYLVRLSDNSNSGFCGGSAISNMYILTAYHCVFNRDIAINQNGDRYQFKLWFGSPKHDFAILKLDKPMILSEYAKFSKLNVNKFSVFYGFCPVYFNNMPRMLFYQSKTEFVPLATDLSIKYNWFTVISKIACGGDSGSPIIQNGKVIGIANAAMGHNLYSVDQSYFIDYVNLFTKGK